MGAQVSERGVYRFTLTHPGGRDERLSGRFHTFAPKVAGRWPFVVDSDSDESGTVDVAKYLAAATVDDFSCF